MARQTASDLISDVKLAIGGPDPTLVLDANVLRWINQAYLEVSSTYDHPALETTTAVTTAASTATYQLAASPVVLTINHILDTTNQFQLLEINCDLYGRYTQGGTTTGAPTHWLEDGVGANNRKNITLWPTPAGVYSLTVHIKKQPDDLVTSPTATSVILHQMWDDVIFHFATARAWKILGDGEKYQMWRQEGELLAKRAAGITERSPQEPISFKSPIAGALR